MRAQKFHREYLFPDNALVYSGQKFSSSFARNARRGRRGEGEELSAKENARAKSSNRLPVCLPKRRSRKRPKGRSNFSRFVKVRSYLRKTFRNLTLTRSRSHIALYLYGFEYPLFRPRACDDLGSKSNSTPNFQLFFRFPRKRERERKEKAVDSARSRSREK